MNLKFFYTLRFLVHSSANTDQKIYLDTLFKKINPRILTTPRETFMSFFNEGNFVKALIDPVSRFIGKLCFKTKAAL